MEGFGGETGRKATAWNSKEDKIKIVLREVRWGLDWIDMAQDMDNCWAFVNAVMKIRAL